MARRLSWRGPAWTGGLGVRRFLGLVLGVVAIHGCVTSELADRMAALAESAKMPPRLEVAYVRTLEPEKPPEVAPAAPPPAPSPAPRAVRARPAKPAASAPPVADAASAAAGEDALRARAEAWVREHTADATAASASAPEAAGSQALAAAGAATPAPDAASAASASLAAASAASLAAASAASAADAHRGIEPARGVAKSAEPFDWPASTRVTYNLSGNYRGEMTGSAQVEWIRVGLKYEVHLDFVVGPEFAPIIRRTMTSSGDLGPDGLAPVRYDEETQVAFRDRRRVTLRFEDAEIVMANGERKERWRGVQDTASQFVQLTYLFTVHPELLRVGNSIEVPLALARSVNRWHYDVLGEVELQTPFGALPAFHLKPRRDVAKPGDLTAEIWFSPQLRYLPVRIRVEQDPQTWADLVIARKPDLAAR